MRVVIVGASSGLGRCIGAGLAEKGAQVALMGRRADLLASAAEEAGANAVAITCDATDEAATADAIAAAADQLGGIDGLVYTAGTAPLVKLADLDVDTWRRAFDTNVIGAAVVTRAALPHLLESSGTAVYLSSVSASSTPPWPGLGAYAASKAALDKMVDAWRVEHPEIGFTRLVVGECAGGSGDSVTQMASAWDLELAAEMVPTWVQRNYMTGALMDVAQLVATVDMILNSDVTANLPSVTVAPRLITPEAFPIHPDEQGS
jgi:NADP-dependent 3-hydroxy acid dehydrogenase YdfG